MCFGDALLKDSMPVSGVIPCRRRRIYAALSFPLTRHLREPAEFTDRACLRPSSSCSFAACTAYHCGSCVSGKAQALQRWLSHLPLFGGQRLRWRRDAFSFSRSSSSIAPWFFQFTCARLVLPRQRNGQRTQVIEIASENVRQRFIYPPLGVSLTGAWEKMLEHLVHAFVEVFGVLSALSGERIARELRQINFSVFASKQIVTKVPTL